MSIKTFMALSVSVVLLPALAEEYLLDALIEKNKFTWYQVSDEGVTNKVDGPIPGVDLKVIALGNNPGQSTDYSFNSVTFDYTNAVSTKMVGTWVDTGSATTIGAGGIAMAANNAWTVGKKANNQGKDRVLVKLGADQTWQGPDGTSWARFCVGYNGYQDYCHASVKALDGVGSWTLDGRLEVFLNGSNELENVDVTVNGSARLFLVGSYDYKASGGTTTYVTDVRLGAKSLTVFGDTPGTRANLIVGKKHDVCTIVGNTTPVSTAPAAFDDATYAPVVTFDGNVVVDADTAEYGLTRLNVRNGDSTFGGDVRLTREAVQIDVGEGASLAFTGTVAEDEGVLTVLTVSGSGRLSLPEGASLAGVALDGATLALPVGSQLPFPVSGTGSLEIEGNGFISMASGDLVGYTGEEIVVKSGTLILTSAAELAAGVRIKTVDDGALVVLDPTGFDADTRMSGTKNLLNGPLVVTDEPIENTTVSVGGDEVLQVFGSGLKASASVEVADGGTIRFYCTASITATVRTKGGAMVETTDHSVTGTLSGAVSSANETGEQRTVLLKSPGLVRLAGGGSVLSEKGTAKTLTLQVEGHVEIVSAELKCSAQFKLVDGDVLICDGGAFNHDSTMNNSQHVYLGAGQTGDVCLTVGAGGCLTLGNNTMLQMGFVKNCESRLVLDGGTINFQTADGFSLNYWGKGDGVFEMRSGMFYTCRQIARAGAGGTAKFIWSGGTIAAPLEGNRFDYETLVGTDVAVEMSGECTLDMDRFTKPVVANAPVGGSPWAVDPSTRLAVQGSATSDWAQKFVLRNADPLAMTLDLNGMRSAIVEIADAAKDVELAWVLPGTNGSVCATGTSPALVASYVVPAGVPFEPSLTDGWHEGFAAVTMKDLTFETGSILKLTTQSGGAIPPLEVPGKLYLPETMTCFVDRAGGAPLDGVQTVVTAEDGIVGECAWTFAGRGMTPDRTTMSVSGNALVFCYKRPGFLLLLR